MILQSEIKAEADKDGFGDIFKGSARRARRKIEREDEKTKLRSSDNHRQVITASTDTEPNADHTIHPSLESLENSPKKT